MRGKERDFSKTSIEIAAEKILICTCTNPSYFKLSGAKMFLRIQCKQGNKFMTNSTRK